LCGLPKRRRFQLVAQADSRCSALRFNLFAIEMKKRILFVGENQPLWQEFQAHAARSGGEWLPEFAGNEPEALAQIEQCEFDAVVADIQLPDTKGVELLDEIMRRQPNSLRVVLSDLADSKSTLMCVARAHRHLLKPFDVTTLINALNQAIALETWLPSAAVQNLTARMRWVPSPPSVYFQVLSEMQSPNASVETIGELIAKDPAISAKVLQLANSAVFGLQLQVISPVEAVTYIGLETTRALMLLAHTFSSFEPLQPAGFSVESLWRHSLFTGHFARAIAQAERSGHELSEQAFAAGLLHDIGKLLFAANLPKPFSQALSLAREQHCGLWYAESQVLGACHAEVGACLLGIWGLPTPIVEAVALHHFPTRRTEQLFTPLTAVHAANVFEHEAQPENAATNSAEIDSGYLEELGLDHHVEEWRRSCLTPDEAAA
jgi:HD-like signal output (HDOD) protein/CheY-like chemotaxis protein